MPPKKIRSKKYDDRVLNPEKYTTRHRHKRDENNHIILDKNNKPVVESIQKRLLEVDNPNASSENAEKRARTESSSQQRGMNLEETDEYYDDPFIGADNDQQLIRIHQMRVQQNNIVWDDTMHKLVDAYINSFRNGVPDYKVSRPTHVNPCNGCQNPNLRSLSVDCIYTTGIIKEENFTYCKNCYSSAPVFFIQHHLFVATPKNTKMAFHLSLLEFYTTLRGYGHTAVNAFGSTMSHVHTYQKDETLSKNLGYAFFRYLELSSLVEEKIVSENPLVKEKEGCPACPRDRMFIALDGNMQLKRYKANEYDKEKYISSQYFSADRKQDQYENFTSESNDNPQSCERNFKATVNVSRGDPKCHECGLVGSICARHDIPLEFTNIYESGEGFKYTLAIINALLQIPNARIVTVMYDIICRIKSSIKKNFPGLSGDGTKMAVSVFHAYAHTMKCQVDFNPRYAKGLGLTDGEGMERLWSYLGQFVSITRPMTAKNRMLTLCHAISFQSNSYCKFAYLLLIIILIITEFIAAKLARRKKNANKVLVNAVSYLHSRRIYRSDQELQDEWNSLAQKIRDNNSVKLTEKEENEEKYIHSLDIFYNTKEQLDEVLEKIRQLQQQETLESQVEILDLLTDLPSFETSFSKSLKKVKAYERKLGIRECDR
ncbi:hypothetical protein BDC45DRAFT_529802 [Circinella umbellata]|nr:hypothetical protein BDC45DRAFT_529802 [Circinella umbellata]